MNNFSKVVVAVAAVCGASVGSAQNRNFELGVQAMIDKAGTTELYISAKPLDTLGAPSVLKQVQMKSFDKAGTLRWTKNLSDVPATVTSNSALATSKLSYTDMQRGQPVQSQVLIQTSETVKTAVYKDKVFVLSRPDLVITKLTAPEKVQPGQPFSVEALIGEVKGDLGAKNIKITLANGTTEIDSIDTIQVAKSGLTTAVFKAQLMSPGTYTLTAQIDGSLPTEYDTTNNTKTVAVTVEDPKPLASHGLLFHSTHDITRSYKGVNTYYDWAWDHSFTSKYRSTGILTQPNQGVALSFPFKVDYHLGFNDAITIASGNGVSIPAMYSWSSNWYCGEATQKWGYANPSPETWVIVTTWSYCGRSFSNAHVYDYFTSYVYFSKQWSPTTGQVIYESSKSNNWGGVHYHTGVTSVQGKIVATDANAVKFGTSAMISAAVQSNQFDWDSGVQTHEWGWFHDKLDESYTLGLAWFNSTPQ